MVAIRPKTGESLAMVGSIDYWNEEIDGNVKVCVADPGRQPGSSFKPFTYATAFAVIRVHSQVSKLVTAIWKLIYQ